MRGTKALIDKLNAYQRAVDTDIPKAIENDVYDKSAQVYNGFADAQYSGDNDVTVSVDASNNEWSINATGAAVLFIEYGTGIKFRHDSDFAGMGGVYAPASWSATHAQYLTDSKKLQSHHGQWPYQGVWLDGDPSANVMYSAQKVLVDSRSALLAANRALEKV